MEPEKSDLPAGFLESWRGLRLWGRSVCVERKLAGSVYVGFFPIQRRLRMNKSILVSLAILTLSTSVALAAHKTHHSRAMKPNASGAATNPTTLAQAGWPGGDMSNKDREMYVKNLHDSGMDKQKPK
jgi:hypothetical protein